MGRKLLDFFLSGMAAVLPQLLARAGKAGMGGKRLAFFCAAVVDVVVGSCLFLLLAAKQKKYNNEACSSLDKMTAAG
jgi:hypothetical protein